MGTLEKKPTPIDGYFMWISSKYSDHLNADEGWPQP